MWLRIRRLLLRVRELLLHCPLPDSHSIYLVMGILETSRQNLRQEWTDPA